MYKEIWWADGRTGGRNGRAGLENLIILPSATKAQFFQKTSKSSMPPRITTKKQAQKLVLTSQRKHQKINKKHAVEMQATLVFERK